MESVLPQLDGPEALLMLLAADELSPGDRQAALLRVNSDVALTARLAALLEAQSALVAGLEALDAATPLPLSAAAAVRQFRQAAVTQRQREIARAPSPVATRRMRLQWWMYPAAAAAVLLVSMMTWWGWHNQDAGTNGQSVMVQAPTHTPGDPSVDSTNTPPADALASTPTDGSASVPPPVAIAVPTPPSGLSPGPSDPAATPADNDDLTGESGLTEAEQQATTLQRRSDPSTITASIFLNDPGAPVE